MALISKVKFKWREPKGFVAARDIVERETAKWWHRVVGAASVALLMMPLWFLATLNPKKDPPSFEVVILLALLLGVFLAYVVPWMIGFCPSEIKINDKMLWRFRGNMHRSIKWSAIDSYSFTEIGGYSVLLLQTRGAEWKIGLNESVERDELDSFLREVGLRQSQI